MAALRLDLYIARRFATMLGLILAVVAVIIFLADFVEVLRRFGDEDGFSGALGLQLAFMRVPHLLDIALPFAFLFAALLALLSLSRRMELVVARGSGVSVWGFLRGPFALALIVGVLAVAVLGPAAGYLKMRAENLEAELSGSSPGETGRWMRQSGPAGASIIHSGSSSADGLVLFGVRAFLYDSEGKIREKVTARRADFARSRWILADAEVVSAASAPRREPRYELPTDLTEDELLRPWLDPEQVSIWSLPAFIATAERTGVDPDPFRLAFHSLLNRPLFLIAMVMIAATVSLRLSRYGGTWRLLLTGVAAGFLLYVLTEIVSDLGANGILNPILAAWLPPIAALTFGATALLYQEDG